MQKWQIDRKEGKTRCQQESTITYGTVELVGADLHVLGDRYGLAFLEDAEAVSLFDGHVLDVVLAVFSNLPMRLFGHDEGFQVAAV
jgi:hypothetical protein